MQLMKSVQFVIAIVLDLVTDDHKVKVTCQLCLYFFTWRDQRLHGSVDVCVMLVTAQAL